MILPGVPRTQRIQFVKTLVELLLCEGLDEITDTELADMSSLVKEILESVEPIKSQAEPEEQENAPEAC